MVEVLDGLITVYFEMHNLKAHLNVFKFSLQICWRHLVTGFNVQVVELDLEEVSRILDVKEVVPAEAQRDPGRDHCQQVLQHCPIERQGQTRIFKMIYF